MSLPPSVERDYPLARLTTIRAGGEAELFARPDHEQQLVQLLSWLTPGDRRVVFSLRGVRCGVLVCYDGCYPEQYAAQRARGVEVVLHSFHNAGFQAPNVLDEYKPALIRTRAADNALWVVACNSSLRHSSWATCVARPDGSIAASLRRHTTGVLVHDFPDPRLPGWLHNLRPLRLSPRTPLHNGRPSRSPRARNSRSEP